MSGLRDNLEREERQNRAGVECGGGEGRAEEGEERSRQWRGRGRALSTSRLSAPLLGAQQQGCRHGHVGAGPPTCLRGGAEMGGSVSLSPRAFLSSEPQKPLPPHYLVCSIRIRGPDGLEAGSGLGSVGSSHCLSAWERLSPLLAGQRALGRGGGWGGKAGHSCFAPAAQPG